MAIEEVREQDLIGRSGQSDETVAVLFFTPLCGTCQIAERMLDVVQATGVDVKLCKININYAPKLRDSWQVASVPCLALIRDGHPVRMEYAMRSVDHLYQLLKEL